MNRHAKAPSAGSTTCQGTGLGRAVRGALALALALVAFCGIGASAALADNTPSVTTNPAESVGVTTAKLSGSVNPNGESGTGTTSWRLEYTPAGAGTWANANSGEITGTEAEEANPVAVEAIFGFAGELQPGAEYEFRLVAENGAGQASSSTRAFTMQAATAPLLTANAAGAVQYAAATLPAANSTPPQQRKPDGLRSAPSPLAAAVLAGRPELLEHPAAKARSKAPKQKRKRHPDRRQTPRCPAEPCSRAANTNRASSPSTPALPRPRSSLSALAPAFTTLAVTAPLVSADAASALTGSAPSSPAKSPTATPTLPSTRAVNSNTSPPPSSAPPRKAASPKPSTSPASPTRSKAPPPPRWKPNRPTSNPTRPTTCASAPPTPAAPPATTPPRPSPPSPSRPRSRPSMSATSTRPPPPCAAGSTPTTPRTTYHFLWGTENCSANPCQAVPVSEKRRRRLRRHAGHRPPGPHRPQPRNHLPLPAGRHQLRRHRRSARPHLHHRRLRPGRLPQRSRPHRTPRHRPRQLPRLGARLTRHLHRRHGRPSGRTRLPPPPNRPASPWRPSSPPSLALPTPWAPASASTSSPSATGAPGTSGWNAHAITPPQEPLAFLASAGQNVDPLYELFSPDLSGGIFRSFSSLPGTSANAFEVPNLYLRDDVRSPGAAIPAPLRLIQSPATPPTPLPSAPQ